VAPLVEGPQVVGPHPGGVDHRTGPYRQPPPVQPVEELGSGHPALTLDEAGGLDVVDHHRSGGGGRLGHRQGEAGVVDAGVVVEEAGGQPAGVEVGHVGHGLGAGQLLVQLADAGPAGGVVHPQGGAEGAGQGPGLGLVGTAAAEDGDEEGEGPYQVGGEAQQPLALGQGLVYETELALVQVAQAAVYEFGGAR
jgi:hypothetical protein